MAEEVRTIIGCFFQLPDFFYLADTLGPQHSLNRWQTSVHCSKDSLRAAKGKKFISEGPSMKIIFTTDEDRNQLGFEARYRIVQNTKVFAKK